MGPFPFTTPIPAPECGGLFVDSGGASGAYSNDEFITNTITPSVSGDAVTITFTFVDIEVSGASGVQDGCFDFLTIYNGPDNTFPVLAETLCGELDGDGDVPSVATSLLQAGDSFTSTDPSGALTIEFVSDGSVTVQGWSADVTCNTLSVDDLENLSAFTFAPNPVTNILTLNSRNTIQNIALYNIVGQEVLNVSPNDIQSDVDMSGLQTGTYFARVTINNSSQTVKLLKR